MSAGFNVVASLGRRNTACLLGDPPGSVEIHLMQAPCFPRILWDGYKPLLLRMLPTCPDVQTILLFLYGTSSAKGSLFCAVKGSAPCVLETEMMKVIPNAVRSVFHHKKLYGLPRASSVCRNGSRGVASHETEPACNGSIPPAQNVVASFSLRCDKWVKRAPAGSMHTMCTLEGASKLCEIH